MLSKYSFLKIKPSPERPGLSLADLETRYKDVRGIWYEPTKAALKATFASYNKIEHIAAGEQGRLDYPYKDSKRNLKQGPTSYTTSERSIDALFCVGIGSFAWERYLEESKSARLMSTGARCFWRSLSQLVLFEAVRDLLSEDFGYTIGVSYIQEPDLNQLDIAFLVSHGYTVTSSVEVDMTNESLLFAPCMPRAISSGMVADYHPKIYLGTFSPTEAQEHTRDGDKLQAYMRAHEGRQFEFEGHYEMWTRKADAGLLTEKQ